MSSDPANPPRREPERVPIWAEPWRGRRQPSITREQIAEAALALADAEGVDAVSMRRVAAELGVGTMTLYHYVRTKDDLYTLVGDRIMGELLVDPSQLDPVDWRSSLAAVARRSRAVFRRHPWMIKAMDQGGEMGPNGLRHFEQSLAAVEGTSLRPAARMEVIALIDDFVFGHALRAAMDEQEIRSARWRETVERYVDEQLATGEYPQIERLLDDGGGDRGAAWRRLAAEINEIDRFERGLQALLDGIERRLA